MSASLNVAVPSKVLRGREKRDLGAGSWAPPPENLGEHCHLRGHADARRRSLMAYRAWTSMSKHLCDPGRDADRHGRSVREQHRYGDADIDREPVPNLNRRASQYDGADIRLLPAGGPIP